MTIPPLTMPQSTMRIYRSKVYIRRNAVIILLDLFDLIAQFFYIESEKLDEEVKELKKQRNQNTMALPARAKRNGR